MGNKFNTWICAILLLTSTSLAALPSDRDQPIHISADKASIDDKTGITLYQGKVDRKSTRLNSSH